jgi:hypothetical protein
MIISENQPNQVNRLVNQFPKDPPFVRHHHHERYKRWPWRLRHLSIYGLIRPHLEQRHLLYRLLHAYPSHSMVVRSTRFPRRLRYVFPILFGLYTIPWWRISLLQYESDALQTNFVPFSPSRWSGWASEAQAGLDEISRGSKSTAEEELVDDCQGWTSDWPKEDDPISCMRAKKYRQLENLSDELVDDMT